MEGELALKDEVIRRLRAEVSFLEEKEREREEQQGQESIQEHTARVLREELEQCSRESSLLRGLAARRMQENGLYLQKIK